MTRDLRPQEREELLGTGIVYIGELDSDAPHRFTSHWESEREGRHLFVEQGPECDDPHEAVAWGRKRAPKVVVRLGLGWGDVRFFTAGDTAVVGDDDEPVFPWPSADES